MVDMIRASHSIPRGWTALSTGRLGRPRCSSLPPQSPPWPWPATTSRTPGDCGGLDARDSTAINTWINTTITNRALNFKRQRHLIPGLPRHALAEMLRLHSSITPMDLDANSSVTSLDLSAIRETFKAVLAAAVAVHRRVVDVA